MKGILRAETYLVSFFMLICSSRSSFCLNFFVVSSHFSDESIKLLFNNLFFVSPVYDALRTTISWCGLKLHRTWLATICCFVSIVFVYPAASRALHYSLQRAQTLCFVSLIHAWLLWWASLFHRPGLAALESSRIGILFYTLLNMLPHYIFFWRSANSILLHGIFLNNHLLRKIWGR